jgi:cytochrome c553
MNPLSEQATKELKEILRTEIGEEKVKLLNDDDIQDVGKFLLALRAEAIKRRLKLHSVADKSISAADDSGALL